MLKAKSRLMASITPESPAVPSTLSISLTVRRMITEKSVSAVQVSGSVSMFFTPKTAVTDSAMSIFSAVCVE